MSRKQLNSADVIASLPLHGGPSVHAATDGMCLPGAWRSALPGFSAADEPQGRPAPGPGRMKVRVVNEELHKKL